MLFEILRGYYDDVGKMKYTCGWCDARIKNNEESYKLKGNMCRKCASKINANFMETREIKETERELKVLRFKLDYYGDKLDHEISEQQRICLVNQMRNLWERIQLKKKTLTNKQSVPSVQESNE